MTTEEIKQIETIEESLNNLRDDFIKTLPKDMDVDKFFQCIISYLKTNTKLLTKTRQTLFNSFDDAAELGLYIDGREAALSYYKEDVKLSPMVGGYVKKLSQAGVNIIARIVYKNDSFKYFTDEQGQHLLHEENVLASDKDRGAGIGAYVIATYPGGRLIDVMSKEDIDKRKEKSQQKDSLMWTTFWQEGWIKTVIRHIYKLLPKNERMDKLVKGEDEEVDLTPSTTADEQAPKPASATPRLDSLIENTPPANNEPAVTQEPKQEPKPFIPASKSVEGVITGIKIRPEQRENKTVNVFRCQVNEIIYSTEDEKIYREQIEPCYNDKLLINLSFIEVDASPFPIRKITMIERVTAEQHFDKPKNKEPKPKKDIPL